MNPPSSPLPEPLVGVNLSLAEILSSLSYALDLTGGQPMGHAQRTCLIGMRLAAEIGLPQADSAALYHALLLKDSGCSSNAARMFAIFGSDDLDAKRASRITDWSNITEALKYAAAHTLPEGSLLARARRMLSIAAHPAAVGDDLMQTRCSRGAQIALSLGLGEAAAACIRSLDEHWNGHGSPAHLQGDAIPLLARIACLAQTLEVFAKTFGLGTAYEVLRARSGQWFDPDLVRAAHAFRQDDRFWQAVQDAPDAALRRLNIHAALEAATEERIDSLCDAFAQIVDAKSPFTGEHSTRVCLYATQLAQDMGFTPRRLTLVRRAALLHDIGKLAVSNAILDKPGSLNDAEWQAVRQHPYYTQQILGQINGFGRLTEIACAHHERLDGKGYFRGLTAPELDTEMRILAVADVFDALSAKRPYRDALPLAEVFAILGKDAHVTLDGDCIGLLQDRYRGQSYAAPLAALPALAAADLLFALPIARAA